MQIQNAILTGSTTVYGPITFVSGTLAGSASYAATSSYADTFTVAGSLTAQTLVVQTITSSVSFITGSTRFGSLLTNTHTFTGSMFLTGSAINVNNSKAIIGDDVSYGAAYQTLAFGSATNGFNRISGHSSTNDGLYFMAATGRGFSFRPNGSTIGNFIIASTGRVGIGTNLSSPSALLHISGSGSDPLMQISSTVSSSIFFVSGSGNIGIGTTTPGSALEIRSGIGNTILGLVPSTNTDYAFIKYTTANGTSYIGTDNSTGAVFGQGAYSMNLYNVGTAPIVFYTAGTARMYISGSGNVGIGTSTPVGKLDVALLNTRRFIVTYDDSIITIKGASDTGAGENLRIIGDNIFFYTGSAGSGGELMRLTNTGRVYIGNTSGDGRFYVKTSTAVSYSPTVYTGTNANIRLETGGTPAQNITTGISMGVGGAAEAYIGAVQNASTYADIVFQSYNGAYGERMRISSAGSVTIGTTEVVGSNSKLIVSSSDAGPSFINQTQGQQTLLCWNKATSGDNLWIEFHAGSSLGVKGSIDYNRASNLTRFNTSSDINLKNIIGDSNKEKSIGILSSTKIREYSWKDDTTNKSQIGVIAQELYQTFKGAVAVGSDESLLGTEGYKPWAVDKTAFTFHLIAGWQEHERIIQELSTKLEEATTRIKTLESK